MHDNPPSFPAAASLRGVQTEEKRLRLWPAAVIITLQWIALTVPGWIMPASMFQFMAMFWGPIIAAVLFIVWWLFASRAPRRDRWLSLLACVVIGAIAFFLFDPTFGLFGLIIYALPVVTTAWLLWLELTFFLHWPVRRAGMLVAVALAFAYFTLLRFDGVFGDMSASVPYRWTPTAEQQFLAEKSGGTQTATVKPIATSEESLEIQPGDWPGFRGPARDGRLTGVRIATDWKQHPPREIWRHRVGPGWSSFTVVATRLYTQEQRGEDEVVVCYDAGTGAELWVHKDAERFTEVVAGPGPRATPTFHEGKIYAMGARGRLNCLDAQSGKAVWSQDIVADSGASVPNWGFAASPCVTQGIVSVFAGGPDGKSVLGYHAASGELAWSAGQGDLSYCSLQPVRIDGVEQLLITTNAGLSAFDPVRGTVLWHYDWPAGEQLARIVQPARIGESDFLLGTGFGKGTRRVHVSRDGSVWTSDEVWATRAISPYFNDLVLHRGHLYGFDNNLFTCLSLEDGKAKWRERGYGNGQVLLLADQNLLLILSEKGDVALVAADSAGRKELARFKAIEGKTWNHPVIAHGKLFVRNGQEAACFELTPERTGETQ